MRRIISPAQNGCISGTGQALLDGQTARNYTGRSKGVAATPGWCLRLPGTGGWDYVYRVVYREMVGEIPDGHQIDHTCKVTLCVRWVHLEAVPPEVNLARSTGWGPTNAQKTTCPSGHLYDYVHQGRRRCRQCDASRKRREAALRRQEAAAYENYEADPEVSFP